jgi:hypothetical protein
MFFAVFRERLFQAIILSVARRIAGQQYHRRKGGAPSKTNKNKKGVVVRWQGAPLGEARHEIYLQGEYRQHTGSTSYQGYLQSGSIRCSSILSTKGSNS